MEKRDLNVSFYKAGNGVSARLNLPKKWMNSMNITPEEKQITLEFDEEKQIIILKKK